MLKQMLVKPSFSGHRGILFIIHRSSFRILAAGLLTVGLRISSASAATSSDVQSAIDNAKAFLYSRQNQNGTWETSQVPLNDKTSYDIAGGQWGGLTALTTYALLACGDSWKSPRLEPAIEFLKSANLRGVYAIGLRAQVWSFLPRQPWIHQAIQRDGRLLLGAVQTQGPGSGMYGYLATSPPDPDHLYDHSVSQYGVLGMWALQESGLEVPDQYWLTVDHAWRRDQLAAGDWSYFAAPQPGYPERISMAAAGVASLFLTDDYLRAPGGISCRGNLSDPDIDRGIDWIGKNFDSIFDPHINRPCYALYGIERIGAAAGRKLLGNVDWYDRGTNYLLAHQSPSGAWDQGDGDVADTALGLLFLIHGRAPVVVNKLDYSSTTPDAAWNQRPRDLAHFTKWFSKTIEANRPLNWQVVTLDTNPDDWHDAPVLYVCGRGPLTMTDNDQIKLLRFIQDGGLIVFNADCADDAFTQSVRQLGRQLTGQDFAELNPNHPLYTHEEFFCRSWRNPPSVLAIGNGAREWMLLIPEADLSAAWQVNAPMLHPEVFQLGADIVQYATDKEHLRYKGESYILKPDPTVTPQRTIKIARLDYGDGWNPEPSGWRRLATYMLNHDAVDLEVERVPLGKGTLLRDGYKIAHLTGTQTVSLSSAARDEISQFIQNGGTLIVDAAGGSTDFAASARHELSQILGDKAAQLQKPLSINNRLYWNNGTQPKLRTQDFQFRLYAHYANGPRLCAIIDNGRPEVFFSPEDLSVGLVGQSVDGIVGYQPQTATMLMERMILESSN